MEARIGTLISLIDVANTGLQAIDELEELVTRLYNIGPRTAEATQLYRQAHATASEARGMIKFERQQAQQEQHELQASAGSPLSAQQES